MALEVVQFKQGRDGKWHVTRLGGAKKNDKGQIVCYLDALPIPTADGCQIVISQKQERQSPRDSTSNEPSHRPEVERMERAVMDDEVPF